MTATVIECIGASKWYGNVQAVDGVSLELESGEILSILGPSGSGKTTLLRLIAGFEKPDAGEIAVQGALVAGGSMEVSPDRRNIGMVFQEHALFPHMTVTQNILFGLRKLNRQNQRRRVVEVIELARLTGLEDRYPHELSGGQQQRVALARTLAPRPVAVLLDEPFSNADVAMRTEMRREVESILRRNDITTIFVTHDREEAFAIADRVGVMREGRLEQLDAPEAIYHSPSTPFVAEMAGMADFLRGYVCGGAVATEIGTLPFVTANKGFIEGASVDLLVRPDDFLIVPSSDGESVVLSREFRGDETVLLIGLPSGATLKSRQWSGSTLVSGEHVSLVPARDSPFVGFQGTEGSPSR